MTIIEPSKTKIPAYFLYLGILFILGSFLGIRLYNSNVNLKYRLSIQEKAMEKLEAMNSDIRNQVFQKLDEKNASALLLKNNLISDKNPVYLEHESLANL